MAFNRCHFSVSGTPGTSGAIVVGSAIDSTWAVPASTDDGFSATLTIYESGLGFEVRTGCVYTHSGTTWSRGTLEQSSSGSAVSFTSAAKAFATLGAEDSRRMLVAAPNVNQTISSQKLICSGHLTIHNALSTATATAANTIYFMPFKLEVGGKFDALGVRVGTGVASSNVRMGLYSINSSGHPGDLIQETSTVSSATSSTDGIGTITSTDLRPGWYYVAVATSSNPALGNAAQGGQIPNLMGQASGNILSAYHGFSASHTFGALPNPAPTTSLTAITTGTALPTVFLRHIA